MQERIFYGPFKQQFTSMEMIPQQWSKNKLSCSLQLWLLGLIVFGGCNPMLTSKSDFVLEKISSDEGLSKKQYLQAWEVAGVAPVTQKCFDSNEVIGI